jgi:hypothetical protein
MMRRWLMEVLDDTFIPPGLSDVGFATRVCPACLAKPLIPVRSRDEAHWLCESCGRCWRVEHGLLRPIDPRSCHGCATRPKSECIEVLQRTLLRFGAGTATDDEYPPKARPDTPDAPPVFDTSFRSLRTETPPTGHHGLGSRRLSLAVDEVHVGPSSDRVSAVGEVLLGPLRRGDTFTMSIGKARDETPVRYTVVGMTRGRRPVTRAKRGTTVRLMLVGDGTEIVRPGGLLLGERTAAAR